MSDRNSVLSDHEHLRELRRPEEPQWREIARLLRPGEASIGTDTNKDRIADDLFDSTPLYALDNFVGGLFGQATNPSDRWFAIGLEDEDLAEWKPVKDWLWKQTNRVFNTFGPGLSTFYAECQPWFADLGSWGLGTQYDEMDPAGRVIDIAIPLSESYIDMDYFGKTTRFHREYKRKVSQLRKIWPSAFSTMSERRELTIIHACFPNPDYRAGVLGPRGMMVRTVYLCVEDPSFWHEGGYYEMPFHPIPWNKRSGRVWPYGPGHIVRPDGNQLQEMERSKIVSMQFAAEPMWLTASEEIMTAADVEPNALIYGGVSEAGKELVKRVDRGTNLQAAEAASEQRRQSIRDAMYFGLMQLVNRPQMTATEFMGFQEERLRLMGPNLTRIQHYGLSPKILRRWRFLERAGQLDPPPPEMERQNMTITYISPLAKAQKLAQGRSTIQWVDGMLRVGEARPDVFDNLDADGYASVLHDAFGAPPATLRDPRLVAEDRKARAQRAAQEQQLAAGEQMANIQATVSHAAQAASRANERQVGQ